MADRPLDLLVVGGGIIGTGIARDAAKRGLRTGLVDRGDIAGGASGRSSRLIHGDLRALELGHLRLVFEASRERRILRRIAPHLVRPRAFLFPVLTGARPTRWKLAAGLWLYDTLALFRNVGRHRWLSKRAMLRAEPGLRDHDLRGGAHYWDAQCDDARLALATARDAHLHGALVATYAEVEQLEYAEGRVRGARVADRVSGQTHSVHAHIVINATGAWSDQFRKDGRPVLRPTRGVYVAVPASRLGNSHAVALTSPIDGRLMFILPWRELSYIGTTDTDDTGSPDEIRATGDDVIYLLRSANALFPDARLQGNDIISTWAGLQPLLRPEAGADASAVPREHRIIEQAGMLSVVGGTLTAYRSVAAQTVDRAIAILQAGDGRPVPPRAATDSDPLPGGEVRDLDVLIEDAVREGFERRTAEYLVHAYGTETPAVTRLARADERLAQPIATGHPAIRAELIHALRREMACTLSDLLMRRTRVFFEVAGNAAAEAAELIDLVAGEAGWDASRKASELSAYYEEVERGNLFRTELVDAADLTNR